MREVGRLAFDAWFVTCICFVQDWVAIDGYPMCDPCLDEEDDVDRMGLAQTDCPDHINMVLEWVDDPDLPFDPVNPINHCACFLIACGFIPIKSKLCWYYPMVHKVTCTFLLFVSMCVSLAYNIILQGPLLKLSKVAPHLTSPKRHKRERTPLVHWRCCELFQCDSCQNVYLCLQMVIAPAPSRAPSPARPRDPLCVCGTATALQCFMGKCWQYNRGSTSRFTRHA
jgi:hypothetical protein